MRDIGRDELETKPERGIENLVRARGGLSDREDAGFAARMSTSSGRLQLL